MPFRLIWPLSAVLCFAFTTGDPSIRSSEPRIDSPTRESGQYKSLGVRIQRENFSPIPNAAGIAGCRSGEVPEPLATPAPLLDAQAAQNKVSLSFIVGRDGRVQSPLILESAGKAEDRVVLALVRTWRYRPALCNGIPTEAEAQIEFSIR